MPHGDYFNIERIQNPYEYSQANARPRGIFSDWKMTIVTDQPTKQHKNLRTDKRTNQLTVMAMYRVGMTTLNEFRIIRIGKPFFQS